MADVIQQTEESCLQCSHERHRRHRVLNGKSTDNHDFHTEPYSSAPALYSFNVPRYFSTNLRAREFAKQNNVQLSWCYAKDIPLHPGDRLTSQTVRVAAETRPTNKPSGKHLRLISWTANTVDGKCGSQSWLISRPERFYIWLDDGPRMHS